MEKTYDGTQLYGANIVWKNIRWSKNRMDKTWEGCITNQAESRGGPLSATHQEQEYDKAYFFLRPGD